MANDLGTISIVELAQLRQARQSVRQHRAQVDGARARTGRRRRRSASIRSTAQIRQVYFFDTPDLALNRAGVVARARRVQGASDDSVVKLRPVVPSELPAELRESPNFVVEVDAMPGGYVCSASMKGKLPPTAVRSSVAGEQPLRKLFSKEQRAFFAAHAPEGSRSTTCRSSARSSSSS